MPTPAPGERDTLSPADIANLLRLAADQLSRLSPAPPPDRLLTAQQAAQQLGVSKHWLYRHAATLPFTVRLGRAVRFSAVGLQTYLDSQHGA